MNIKARSLALAAAVVVLVAAARSAPPAGPTIVVYKSPTCGCCAKWVDHLKANGFTVVVHDTDDLGSVNASFGVTAALQSCHTATVAGYVIEGHVPADLIQRLLKDKPKVAGLTIPGMPQSAPGMDMAGQPYTVLTFDKAGKTAVYARR